MPMAAAAALLSLLPCFVLALRHSQADSAAALATRAACPERPDWDYSKDPPGCHDSATETEVDDECCVEERICGTKASAIVDEHARRLTDVYVAKCGLSQESDLAKVADGGEVQVQVTNREPLCSTTCQSAEELEHVTDGALTVLSDECAAYPEVAALVDRAEHVIVTRAVDEAWESCSKGATSTLPGPAAPEPGPEGRCPPGFFPRQCLVHRSPGAWRQSLSHQGCRGNLLVLRLPKTLTGLLGAIGPDPPPAVLLRVKGTRAVTDWTRRIPKGLEISADQGITIKHRDRLALDLEVLDADGSVARSFPAATSLTFAPSALDGGADALYRHTTINPFWHLGYMIGIPVSPPGTEVVRGLPTVPDDRLRACSDESAPHVNEPDSEDEPWEWPAESGGEENHMFDDMGLHIWFADRDHM